MRTFLSHRTRGRRLAVAATGFALAIAVAFMVLAVPEERGGGVRRAHAAPRFVAQPGSVPPPGQATTTTVPFLLHATAAQAQAVVDRSGVIRQLASVDGGGPVVALTFDDGPDPAWTPQVLDVLRRAGIHATFCLVGMWAQRRPDLARAIVADGNTLCDHTEHHVEHLDRHRPVEIDAEIAGGASAITAAGVPAARYYRAPGGSLSPFVIDVAHSHNLAVLGWSVDPRDWKAPPADQIAAYVLGAVKPGSIVLLHDGGGDRSQTLAALPDIIRTLTDRGYRFATVP